jgi:hypothetical protein
MKELPFMNASQVYVEITQTSLKILRENDGLDLPLERSAGGQLTDSCKEKLVRGLEAFLQRRNWQPRTRALCAIGASGLSLRRIALPATARDELPKLLRLQIESEFPLSPDELAWGYRVLGPAANGVAKQELLVAAVKKDRVDEYASLLLAAGLNPVFTPAVLARATLCPQPLGSCALLDVAEKQLEFVSFENGVPVTVRTFPWDAENKEANNSRLDSIAKAIGRPLGNKIYVTGDNGAPAEFIASIRQRFPIGVQCERVETAAAIGHSAAVLGLKRAAEENIGATPLLLQADAKPTARGALEFAQPVPKQWAIRAAVLLCALLALPYAEAVLLKSHLAKKLSAIRANQGRLSAIDHEFDFLSFLKQNEPPYLDALYLFAKAAPPGTHLDSTSMNRRGEITLRGSMQNAQQVTDFRSKLIDTGFFERVTVDEQVPTPDRQKVNIRITAQWKPVQARARLAIGPTHDEIEKAKTNTTAQAGMPPGMPPGLIMQ